MGACTVGYNIDTNQSHNQQLKKWFPIKERIKTIWYASNSKMHILYRIIMPEIWQLYSLYNKKGLSIYIESPSMDVFI